MKDDYQMSFLDYNQFGDRLAELRINHGISARDLSLSIGQNEHYINQIENHCFYPSMQAFIYICEYLNITPCQFFDLDATNPQVINHFKKHIPDLTRDNQELLILLTLCLK